MTYLRKLLFQIVCFGVPPVDQSKTGHFWAYANLTVASFKLQQPNLRAILLSLKKAKVPKGLLFDKIQRSGNPRHLSQGLMVDELECWLHFVKSTLFDRPTILIDPDLLYQHDITAVFKKRFDIGLTWRDVRDDPKPTTFNTAFKNHPFNAGVIFLNPARKSKVIAFFETCLTLLQAMDKEFWKWYGDQEAILKTSGRENNLAFEPNYWEYNGIKFKSFLCEDYNFSQPYVPNGRYILSHYNSPYIVHFKGKRSILMFEYAQKYLGIKLSSDKKSPGGVKIYV